MVFNLALGRVARKVKETSNTTTFEKEQNTYF